MDGTGATPLICVYAGSSPGSRPEYAHAAEALGDAIVASGHGLVFGGGAVGLMGKVADAVLRRGGTAIGVIPEALLARDVAHRGLTELRIAGSMHERKAAMAALASGFVALPGGFGTLDELFEVLTWVQLGIHTKAVGLVNSAGYYDPLLAFLAHAAAERFLKPSHLATLHVEEDPHALLAAMARHQPPDTDKWMDRAGD